MTDDEQILTWCDEGMHYFRGEPRLVRVRRLEVVGADRKGSVSGWVESSLAVCAKHYSSLRRASEPRIDNSEAR